jgi:hypothetical protein
MTWSADKDSAPAPPDGTSSRMALQARSTSALMARGGAGVLAALNLWWGAWARFAPHNFFDTFPGFGHHWTAAYPPYNEHLVTDLGSTFLTLGLLLVVGAVTTDRRIRRLVLAAVLVFNALHLGFHAGHRGTMDPFDFEASVATLAAGVALPLALVVIEATHPRSRSGQRAG